MSATHSSPDQLTDEDEGYVRGSGEEMDERRREALALEYLKRLEEARVWLGDVFEEEDWLSRGVEMEEELRSGVPLARLAAHFAPKVVPKSRVFDADLGRYRGSGLHFRHTDNTSQWIRAMRSVGLPEIFIPDTADVYDAKNLPKAVFCLHALSIFLHRKGLAPPMRGGADHSFTEEEVSLMARILAERGIKLPPFSRVGGLLADELSKDETEVHLAVVAINEAVEAGDSEELQNRLRAPEAQIQLVRPPRKDLYLTSLAAARHTKIASNAGKDSEDIYDRNLNQREIQALVDEVNVSDGMSAVNLALSQDAEALVKALRDPGLRLPNIHVPAARLYWAQLSAAQPRPLGRSETEAAVKDVNAAYSACTAAEPSAVMSELEKMGLDGLQTGLAEQYAAAIAAALKERQDNENPFLSPAELQAIVDAVNKRNDSAASIVHLASVLGSASPSVEEQRAAWDRLSGHLRAFYAHLVPVYSTRLRRLLDDGEKSRESLTMEDLQGVVDAGKVDEETAGRVLQVVRELNTELSLEKPDPNRVFYHLESHKEMLDAPLLPCAPLYTAMLCKAKNAKAGGEDSLACRLPSGAEFFSTAGSAAPETSEPTAPSANLSLQEVQACVRDGNSATHFFEEKQADLVKTQAQVRMVLARRAYKERLAYLAAHNDAARTIQAHMRRRQAAADFKALLTTESPSLPLVRKFAAQLRSSEADYAAEAELQALRGSVAAEAAAVQRTEADLQDMDTKIGLLVQNCINLEEVLRHGQKLREATAATEEGAAEAPKPKDIGSRRSSRRLDPKLGFYQQLLYLLQTQPQHLTNMALARGQSPKAFADSAILPLFGFASGRREEFLLLKLLGHATSVQVAALRSLEEAVRASLPPTVASFCRQLLGESAGGRRLGKLMGELLKDRPEHINIDPLEIYKYAVGEPPEKMTAVEAASTDAVAAVLSRSLAYIQGWAARFLAALVAQPDENPYPLRLALKSYAEALVRTFPDAGRRDREKTVAAVLFETTARPLLLAPEHHGLIPETSKVSDDQRKICASIAKLISFGVENKGFGEENAYLSPLNESIRGFHDDFRGYVNKVTSVAEPEEVYGMDELSDLTASREPTLTISLAAVHFLHQASEKWNKSKGSDLTWSLLLKQLGPTPSLTALAGIFCEEVGGDSEGGLGERKVTIHLRAPNSQTSLAPDAEKRRKFAQAKALLTEVVLCQGAATVPLLLSTAASASQEAAHAALRGPGEAADLEERKAELGELLEDLDELGLVSADDDFQALVTAIAQDVRSESRQRESRAAELGRVRRRLEDVRAKKAYQGEQAAAYNAYITDCLANLAPKTKDAGRRGSVLDAETRQKSAVSGKTIRYSGEKLAKKRVLVEIRDVPTKKWGDHKFELSNVSPGVFNVEYKLGDKTQNRTMNLQELLKLQYDGTSSVTVFSGVILDLDPLLLLLNKKFYC